MYVYIYITHTHTHTYIYIQTYNIIICMINFRGLFHHMPHGNYIFIYYLKMHMHCQVK